MEVIYEGQTFHFSDFDPFQYERIDFTIPFQIQYHPNGKLNSLVICAKRGKPIEFMLGSSQISIDDHECVVQVYVENERIHVDVLRFDNE